MKETVFEFSPSDVISLNEKYIAVVGINGKSKDHFFKVYNYYDRWAESFTLQSYGLDNAIIQGLAFNKLKNKLMIAYNGNKISTFNRNYKRLAKTYPDSSVTNSADLELFDTDELTSIESIACNDNYFYVFDSSKQQIFIFDLNLKYSGKFKIDFKPNQMKANNDTICFGLREILYFYNIKTKIFTDKFECKVGKINVINSIFYVFNYQLKKYYIFDAFGVLCGEIDAKKIFSFDATEDDGAFTFDGKFVLIALNTAKKISRLMLTSDSENSDDSEEEDNDEMLGSDSQESDDTDEEENDEDNNE